MFFKLGKLHIPHRKNTAEMPAVKVTPPSEVEILMAQHIGAPANPVVKVGDQVFVGTLIGEAQGYVSSPVYSSVSGKVKKIDSHLLANGRTCQSIIIESDSEMTPDPSIAAPVVENFDDFRAAVSKSGLVGLGGAGFPTAIKLDAEKKGIIKKIVVNGAECEPYITSDTRTMIDDIDHIRAGVDLMLKYISADEVIFGVEENKPLCIAKLREAFTDYSNVKVESLPSTYPQGAEKMLIFNTTGLVVPEGGLPADVGCIVLNVTSLAFIARYIETGMPLVEKCITVDGSAIKNPMNVIAPIGTRISHLIEFVGGYEGEVGKVLYGGPMMGSAVYTDSEPVLKNTNAIIALSRADSVAPKSYPCIHCGRCVAACPMGLNPTAYAKAMKVEDGADRSARLNDAKINLCIECGCCSYACPSRRPLVETNRLAKADLRDYQAKQKALEAKEKEAAK